MPKVRTEGPYDLFFYSDEGAEPPHVHVRRDDRVAKFWLAPVGLADGSGFARPELRRMLRIVIQFEVECLRKRDEHFNRP